MTPGTTECNMNLSAFILAAGRGERLRPITDSIPKPLLPVLGKPVLQTVLEKISGLRMRKIGMNLHHKKESIERWIEQFSYKHSLVLFPEDPLLGTGGALKNAETFLDSSAFLVHNADIVSDIDLGKLIESHLTSGNLATLAIHNYPEFNTLEVDETGFFKGIFHHPNPNPPSSRGRKGKDNIAPFHTRETSQDITPSPSGRGLWGGGKMLAFTGIAVYQPEFLRFLPEGSSSVVDAWFNARSAGHIIGTFDVSGCSWNDIGTPVSYARAVIDALRREGETVFIYPSAEGCGGIEMNGYLVIEKDNTLPRGISLRNCIVLPDATISFSVKDTPPSPPLAKKGMKGGSFENCILGPGFRINLNESEMLGADSGEDERILIGVGGSDRQYFRMKKDGQNVIFMQCKGDDPDFERHIEYSRFLQNYSVPVPDLRETDLQSKTAVFEDLGDTSFYSWLKCLRAEEEIETMYRQVLDILNSIHVGATGHVAECPLLENRIFDYAYLRWETDYFAQSFLPRVCKLPPETIAVLSDEFHQLATTVDSFQKTIIHRDFQSQNIMITSGNIPRVLDYQGARMAPPAYDVASILWDPYYRIDDALRERLLEYYVRKMTSANPPQSPFADRKPRGIPEDEFRESLLPCRLQRHMQALGAYAFLSAKRGKEYFLKHIPEGLRLLKEDVARSEKIYPELYTVVMGLKEIVL
ncbi:MAG: phosphotransferase [Thermodesulfovibrionales bacterium]|nr:phosphotransferase [Thermodesulfovibrionales bacterium]